MKHLFALLTALCLMLTACPALAAEPESFFGPEVFPAP